MRDADATSGQDTQMKQPALDLFRPPVVPMAPLTTRMGRVAQFFHENPDIWIDGMRLAQIGGSYAWRTRVSECRGLGMDIENRQRHEGKRVISEYRYRPAGIPEARTSPRAAYETD